MIGSPHLGAKVVVLIDRLPTDGGLTQCRVPEQAVEMCGRAKGCVDAWDRLEATQLLGGCILREACLEGPRVR